MRPIPATRLGDAHGLLRAIEKRGRLRTDEFVTEFNLDELFPPDLENAVGRLRHFISFGRLTGLVKEDRGVVELTDIGKRYIRSGDPDNPFDVSPQQAEWLRRQLREKHMTDSVFHGLAIGLSLLASLPPGTRVSTMDFGRSMAYLGRAGWDNENTLAIQGERHLILLTDLELIDGEHRLTSTGEQVRGELTLPVHMSLSDIAAQLNPGGAEAVRQAAAAEWAEPEPPPPPPVVEQPSPVEPDEQEDEAEEEDDEDGGYHTVIGPSPVVSSESAHPPIVPRAGGAPPPKPAAMSSGDPLLPFAGAPSRAPGLTPGDPLQGPSTPPPSAGPPEGSAASVSVPPPGASEAPPSGDSVPPPGEVAGPGEAPASSPPPSTDISASGEAAVVSAPPPGEVAGPGEAPASAAPPAADVSAPGEGAVGEAPAVSAPPPGDVSGPGEAPASSPPPSTDTSAPGEAAVDGAAAGEAAAVSAPPPGEASASSAPPPGEASARSAPPAADISAPGESAVGEAPAVSVPPPGEVAGPGEAPASSPPPSADISAPGAAAVDEAPAGEAPAGSVPPPGEVAGPGEASASSPPAADVSAPGEGSMDEGAVGEAPAVSAPPPGDVSAPGEASASSAPPATDVSAPGERAVGEAAVGSAPPPGDVSGPGDAPASSAPPAVADVSGHDEGGVSSAPAAAIQPPVFVDAATVRAAAIAAGLRLPAGVYASVAAALGAGKHLILTGAPGAGKTTLAMAVTRAAAQEGRARGATVVTGHPPLDLLVESATQGRWVIVDELDRTDPDDAFGALSSFLAGIPVAFQDKGEAVATDTWRIVATWNGAAPRAAIMRRFAVIEVAPPPQDELRQAIRHAANQDATATQATERLLRYADRLGAGVLLDAARHAALRQAAEATDEATLARELIAAYVAPLIEDA